MASWTDLEAYNKMIEQLGQFSKAVIRECGYIDGAATDMVLLMEDRELSLRGYDEMMKTKESFAEIARTALFLAQELAEERDALSEYLRGLDELEENADGEPKSEWLDELDGLDAELRDALDSLLKMEESRGIEDPAVRAGVRGNVQIKRSGKKVKQAFLALEQAFLENPYSPVISTLGKQIDFTVDV